MIHNSNNKTLNNRNQIASTYGHRAKSKQQADSQKSTTESRFFSYKPQINDITKSPFLAPIYQSDHPFIQRNTGPSFNNKHASNTPLQIRNMNQNPLPNFIGGDNKNRIVNQMQFEKVSLPAYRLKDGSPNERTGPSVLDLFLAKSASAHPQMLERN